MLLLTMNVVLLCSWAMKPAQSFQQLIIPSRSSYISIPTPSLLMGVRHDYERDISSDTSQVDVNAVNDLLGERLRARKTGDFDVADKIRDQLSAEHSVTVFDKDKIWVTGESARSVGGRSGGRGGRGGREGRGRGGRGRGGMDRGRRDFRSNFGPNGHDYNLCPLSGPISSQLSETAIHSKVAERLSAKMNRDFDTADRVQLELAEDGVFVNDRTKEWRADGVRFIDPSEGRRAPSDRNRPYTESRYSQSLPENAKVSLARIGELVEERTQCKKNRRFTEADSIRDALEKSHDVVIDDRVREWSIGGSFGKDADIKRAHSAALQNRSYVKSSASLELPEGVTQNDVQARVDARTRAKTNRQYSKSDALRDEIHKEFNVVIDDAIKMWSVGGDFGLDHPDNARAQNRGKFTRRGGGNLSESDVGLIQEMLKNRFELKSNRNFEKADQIRDHLYEKYNINVDDKSQEWRVLSDDYIQTKAERGTQELTGMDVSFVTSQLAKRIILKKDRDYGEADTIRDDLQGSYSILIDDKKREWKVISSSGKSKFAQGAARSQPSPYKQKQIEDKVENDPWFDDADDTVAVDITARADAEPEEENASSPSSISRDELMSFTVPLLKEKLREAGKPVSGRKADLVDRLLA